MRRLVSGCVAAMLAAVLLVSAAYAEAPRGNAVLPVPQRSQFDGTKWAASDCGPASLGMILASFGDTTPIYRLRERANQIMRVSDPENGTRIQDLAAIAQEHGLSINGPADGGNLGHWTPSELRYEIRQGRPVLLETAFYYLPYQVNRYVSDHFVVLVGTDGDDFLVNDPADAKVPGYRQRMTQAELMTAWDKAKRPHLAFSVGWGGAGQVKPASTFRDPLLAPAVVVPLYADTVAAAITPQDVPEAVPLSAVVPVDTNASGVTTTSVWTDVLSLLHLGRSW